MIFALRERVPLRESANVRAVPVGSSLQGKGHQRVFHANPDSTLPGGIQLHVCDADQSCVSAGSARQAICLRVVCRQCSRQYFRPSILLTHALSVPLVPPGVERQRIVMCVLLAHLPGRGVAFVHHVRVERFRAEGLLLAPSAHEGSTDALEAATNVELVLKVRMPISRAHASAKNASAEQSPQQRER